MLFHFSSWPCHTTISNSGASAAFRAGWGRREERQEGCGLGSPGIILPWCSGVPGTHMVGLSNGTFMGSLETFCGDLPISLISTMYFQAYF